MSDENQKLTLELIGIRLENYLSYKKFPSNEKYLELGKFTTIIGKNDVGKSNLLDAINLVLNNAKISWNDLHKGIKEDCNIVLYFKIPSSELKDELKDTLRIHREPLDNDLIELKKTFTVTNEKIGAGIYYINGEKIQYKNISQYLPKTLYIQAVKRVEDELRFSKDTLISELFIPIIEKTDEEKNGSNTVAKLRESLTEALQQETEKLREKLKDELVKMWDDVTDVVIDIPELRLEKAFTPIIKIRDKNMIKEIPITYRGSGMQRYFILALLELYRQLKIGKGYILLFEEPEIYLHIGAQKRMHSILKDISKEGQVIISTHSTIFVDRSDIRATYLFYKENGETKFRKFNGNKDDLEELGISPSDIFLTNGIIFVEGPSDAEVLKIFVNHLFKNWDEYNVEIIGLGGSNIEHQKSETLLSVNPNIAMILDADVHREVTTQYPKKYYDLKQQFKTDMIHIHFWKKDGQYVRELENLFDKESIEKALNITLEGDVDFYEDVPLKIGKQLVQREAENNPNLNLSQLTNSDYKNRYKKIKHGKKIAKKMVELDKVPLDIKEIVSEILKEFNLNSNE